MNCFPGFSQGTSGLSFEPELPGPGCRGSRGIPPALLTAGSDRRLLQRVFGMFGHAQVSLVSDGKQPSDVFLG
jgi:hypothetical protein